MPGHPSFHKVIHGGFLFYLHNVHCASNALEMAKKVEEERNIAMKEARSSYMYWLDLVILERFRGGATWFQLDAISTAETTLHERNRLLTESKFQLRTAEWNYQEACAAFVRAKLNCGSARCPESHDNQHETLGTSENGHGGASSENMNRARPTAQSTTTAKLTVPTRATANSPTYNEWVSAAQEALKDYSALSSFPSPPTKPCSNMSCMNATKNPTRALTACACKIREGLQYLSVSQLKSLRLLFHPDKFSKCRADRVELFKRQASEVFVVVEAMYREKCELVIADEDVEMTDCDL
jgi:hypothetical protein